MWFQRIMTKALFVVLFCQPKPDECVCVCVCVFIVFFNPICDIYLTPQPTSSSTECIYGERPNRKSCCCRWCLSLWIPSDFVGPSQCQWIVLCTCIPTTTKKKPYKKPRRQKQCCDFEHLCGIDKMARMWSCSTLRTSSSFIFHCLAVTFLLSWAIVRVPRTVRALLQRCHKIIQSYDKQMRLPCL